MKLTPIDLQQKSFRKLRLGGVDEKEVRAFLEACASEMEDLIRKLHQQDEELLVELADQVLHLGGAGLEERAHLLLVHAAEAQLAEGLLLQVDRSQLHGLGRYS